MKKLLLTPKECQHVLNIGNTKFYEIVKDENFPKPVVVGKSKFWRTEDLEKWVMSLEACA